MHSEQETSLEPRARQAALRAIGPTRETAKENRDLLLSIFAEEVKYRQRDDDWEFYENLYWCAFLLYLAGDLRDVPSIWRAKRINMDTGTGLDGQCLVGAGVVQTVHYLNGINELEIVAYISGMNECGDLDDLAAWEEAQRQHFYGAAA